MAKTASTANRRKGKGKGKRAFDLTGKGGNYAESDTDILDGPDSANGVLNGDDSIIQTGKDQPMADSVIAEETLGADQTEEQPMMLNTEDNELMGPPATSGAKESSKKRGRIPKTKTLNHDESQMPESVPEQPRRGRPPKMTQVYQDPDTDIPTASSPRPKGNRPPPPSLRDSNTRSKITKSGNGKPPSRTGSVAAGPRFVQRSETPANDSGAIITRFGRQSIKPLATWRGEKTVMGDRTFDTLPGIKEVIRVDEVVESRPKQRYRKGRSHARSRLADVEEEEIDEEKDPWELDPGIMVAQVMDWDANTNKYDEESTREEGESPLATGSM